MLARSAISLTEKPGGAISACEGAALVGWAGWTEKSPAVATGVDFIAPPALEGEDQVRPGFVFILLSFLPLLFVSFEPPLRLRLCTAGKPRGTLPGSSRTPAIAIV